jgi:putative transcriptional regulator
MARRTQLNTIRHHPDDASLVACAAGTLNPGQAAAVAAHIERCARCAERQSLALGLGAALLEAQEPAGFSADLFERCWDQIASGPRIEDTRAGVDQWQAAFAFPDVPRELAAHVPNGLDALPWRNLTPLIKQHLIRDLSGPDGWTRLFLFLPGCEIPQHGHTEGEMTLVLRGAYCDQLGHFGPGDLADLDTSHRHNPVIAGDEPCIALIATAGHVRFDRLAHRLFARIAGI